MICTAAAIVHFLGYLPAPGAVVAIPASQLAHYSRVELAAAKLCARRYRINWRIDRRN